MSYEEGVCLQVETEAVAQRRVKRHRRRSCTRWLRTNLQAYLVANPLVVFGIHPIKEEIVLWFALYWRLGNWNVIYQTTYNGDSYDSWSIQSG